MATRARSHETNAGADEARAFADDETRESLGARPERDANSHFPRSQRDRERHDAVEAHRTRSV